MEMLFGVKKIPPDTQIKMLVDRIKPERFWEVFSEALKVADGQGVIDDFRVPGGGVLTALDGGVVSLVGEDTLCTVSTYNRRRGNGVVSQCAGGDDSKTGYQPGIASNGGDDTERRRVGETGL
jgi:hypothetical protein